MFNLKKISTILILLLIGLLIMSVSLIRIPKKEFNEKNYKMELHPFSISFYDHLGTKILGISPLDEQYYQGSVKKPLLSDSNFRQSRSLFQQLFNPNELNWSVNKDNINISYQIVNKDNGITILRSFKGYDPKTEAIGESITICDDCLLSNGEGLIYVPEENIVQTRLDYIQKLNLVPLIFSHNQLPLGSRLVILDSKGKRKFEVLSRSQAYFYETWHILEIKIPVNSKNLTTEEVISFQ